MIILDPEQEAGAAWVASMNGTCILGDTMGIGKTYTAISGVVRLGRWPVLCIVANPLKHVWVNHYHDWDASITVLPLEGRTPHRLAFPPDVVVINFAILDAWRKELTEYPWAQVIIDEAHKCGGHDTGSFKACVKVCDRVRENGGGILLLSGTPYTNKTTDAWRLFRLIDPSLFPEREKFERIYDAENFAKRKCLIGAFVRRRTRQDAMREFAKLKRSGQIMKTTPEQLDQLKAKIAPYLMRRTVSSSWQPAPEEDTVHAVELLEDEIAAIDRNLQPEDWMKGRRRSVDFDDGQLCHALAVIAEAKAPYCAQWVAKWLKDNYPRKIVVCYKHKAMRHAIYEATRHVCVCLDGTAQNKAAGEKKFQTEEWARVALLHVSSTALGLTLCAAADMYFAEKPWTAADFSQARARINRRGQVEPICRYTSCVATDTLDELVDRIITMKAKLSKHLLGD